MKILYPALFALISLGILSPAYGIITLSLNPDAKMITINGSVGAGSDPDPVYTPGWGGGVSMWIDFGDSDYDVSFPSINGVSNTSATFGSMNSQDISFYTNDGEGVTLIVNWATKEETTGVLAFNNTQIDLNTWDDLDIAKMEGYFDSDDFRVREYFDNFGNSDVALTVAAVPEVKTFGLVLGLMMGAFAGLRRRKQTVQVS